MRPTEDEYTAKQARAAVLRGARWLDRKCPEWIKEIDLDQLDLSDPALCVLGQTSTCLLIPEATPYTSFRSVLHKFGGDDTDKWAGRRGFMDFPTKRDDWVSYEMLTIAWKEYIRQRLEAVS